jgi:predicted DNA-binding ribbon-helix-helix protein
VKERSIVIGRHKTSISLEDSFWSSLRQIGQARATTGTLDESRNYGNLSSSAECSFSTATGRRWCGLGRFTTASP